MDEDRKDIGDIGTGCLILDTGYWLDKIQVIIIWVQL